MPRDPLPTETAHPGRVAVHAPDGRLLDPCHPARARELVRRGRARLVRRLPPVIRLRVRREAS